MSDEQGQQEAAQAGVTTEEGSLLDQILAETKLKPKDDAYTVAKQGVHAFISELVRPDREGIKADRLAVDAMIAEIDDRISAQVNEILHHKEFQKIESAWRSLKFLTDKVDFQQNIKVEVLQLNRDDLASDLEDAPDLTKSGFYKIAYSNEYGQFGGEPFGLICGNYDFGPGAADVQLLSNVAAISAMAHAPFLTNTGAEFFGDDSFEDLPKLKDIKSHLDGPQFTKWNSFRDNPDSAYVGMCMPRFLLRTPYDPESNPIKAFNFSEEVIGKHENYLWGHASIAMATRIADSFAKYRWCPNIIGPQSGGTVENLPLHQYEAMGEIQTKVPTEVMLTERREFELAEEGFIALTFRKDSDNACFFSANSPQRSKRFGNTPEGKAQETNFKLGTQLPYIFVVSRLAHYLKVMQREQLGSFKERSDLQRELGSWISGYVSDMDNPAAAVRATRPLRKAKIIVEDVPGQPGWFQCRMEVQPHMKYMGASFTLSLVGRLEK